MKETQKVAFALLRYALCATDIPQDVRGLITKSRLEQVYQLLKTHDLAHLGYDGLLSLEDDELATTEIYKQFKRQQQFAVYRYEQKRYEYEQICATFEEAGISYLPLKGAVIKAYYPQEWMRTSCDIDILVQAEEIDSAVNVLVEKLQYKVGERDAHEVSLFSKGGEHLELHFKLIDARVSKRGEQILLNIWQYCEEVKEDCFARKMTDEAFYFYHIAHMAKHFELGGCGIRSFIDVWILNHKIEFGKEKREKFLREGELSRFETIAKKLSDIWLMQEKHDAYTQDMQDYILRGGVYGNMANKVAVQQVKKGGRLRYIFSRIFVSYETLVVLYPSLKQHKWLLPFYQIRRWGRFFMKGKAKDSARELHVASAVSKENKKKTQKLLRHLGL